MIEPVSPFLDAVSEQLLGQVNSFDASLATYAEYALTGAGKHLRPALVSLSASALGGVKPGHVTAAVVIEMVHLATLVHDDVMDEAELRRGRLTLAANWGNEIAVLFGDCLFAQALKLAASFPTPEVCRAVSAATNTVCAGEILQTRNRGNFDFSEEDYIRVIDMKTAELFALSCDLAAFMAEASDADREALNQFGRSFGMAYQIYDDCLDLYGSERKAGKSLGTDLVKGKLTLPLLRLKQVAAPEDVKRLKSLISGVQNGSPSGVSDLLHKYDVLPTCAARINSHLAASQESLDRLQPSEGRTKLAECSDYLKRQVATLANSAAG